MKIFIALLLLTTTLICQAEKPVSAPTTTQEEDIVKCAKDSDCVIVPYKHCCGSTKKAINKKFLDLYNKTPQWQKFDNQNLCAVMGACVSDEKVKEAKCGVGQCYLRYPEK